MARIDDDEALDDLNALSLQDYAQPHSAVPPSQNNYQTVKDKDEEETGVVKDDLNDGFQLQFNDSFLNEGNLGGQNQDEDNNTVFSPLEMLQALFPTADLDRIQHILVKCNYDLSEALEEFYSQSDTHTNTVNNNINEPASSSPPKNTQICRHFLAGGCYRADW
jgi:hypothetical protein